MLILALVVAALAVARITLLLVEDRIANGYRRWVVRKFGPDSMASYLVHCPWCTSVWVALPIMPLTTFTVLPWNQAATWLVAALSIPAASMVTGMLLDRKE